MTAPVADDPLKELRSSGWLIIAVGVISIVAGVLAIAYPDITLLALAIFTGVNLMVMGVFSLVDAFASDADSGVRTLSAILGVLGLIAGLVVLRRPGETLRRADPRDRDLARRLGRRAAHPRPRGARGPCAAHARGLRRDRARRPDLDPPRSQPPHRRRSSRASASSCAARWPSTPAGTCARPATPPLNGSPPPPDDVPAPPLVSHGTQRADRRRLPRGRPVTASRPRSPRSG